jgi:hypothetical protein
MNLFRLNSAFAMAILASGAMAITACSDDDDPDAGPNDSGVVNNQMDATEGGDAEVTDVRVDAGRIDAGDGGRPDTGIAPPDRCINGTEGCECTSTATAAVVPFRQESCATPDLVCVPWDLISGLAIGGANPQLEGEVKTCLKPCTADAECGANRQCRSFGFTEESGAGRVCVDRVASFDEFCSGSRNDVEQIVDPAVMDGADEIIACADGLTCQLFTFADSFNPEESLCVEFCETNTDCTHPELPYCNPRFFASTSTSNPFLGVCTDGPHPNGALCGSSDPNKVFRVSTGCDTSVDTCGANADACPVCVGINFDANTSLTPEGQGICMSPCSANVPCADQRTCIPNFFQGGDGVCSDSCTSIPETCPGMGSLGNGEDCLELGEGSSFCVDRYTPVLAPSRWSTVGQITLPGDDCAGDLGNYSFFRCPDDSTCLPTAEQGFCVYGCVPRDPVQGTPLCQTILGTATATCTEPQAGFGVCGDI